MLGAWCLMLAGRQAVGPISIWKATLGFSDRTHSEVDILGLIRRVYILFRRPLQLSTIYLAQDSQSLG